ncbi:MAG: DnaD domain protein [Dehalococcoidia bacterium]|nr:DnaD domain protein [Dehalococcoidia bacterium]
MTFVQKPSADLRKFTGFPAGAKGTIIPSLFFAEVMPQIEDEAELRVSLYLFYALGRRKGYPRFLTERELRSEGPLLEQLATEDLRQALDKAVERGTLLRLDVEKDGRAESLYFVNTPSDRRAVEQIRDGRIELGRALPAETGAPASLRGNVFQLYEENIGPLTPLVAEELKEAERLYPIEWLEEALREAALLNKRSWRYAAAILQRWATEGRTRETAGRDTDGANTARAQFIRRYRGLGG